jgi:AraC family transcriptional regulator of adaptative response/methylated-DNA-[protein]-cysteine methyltransferase
MTIADPAFLADARAAFARRDRAWDGAFVAAVKTTGIYCRPSCPARRPLAKNVLYYKEPSAAEADGYRPCRRCRPDEAARDKVAVERALVLLREAETAPRLAQLAAAVSYSPAHLQRIFKRATGLSPAAFYRALREERARESLEKGESVTEAIYEAGFGSASRFYEGMEGKLGMAPSAWAKGGEGVRIAWIVAKTSLGPILLAASGRGVCRLSFNEGAKELARIFPKAELVEGGPELASLIDRVIAQVEQPGRAHDIPLDIAGTAFQQRVWEQLRRIPPGETRSYSELAAAAGHPRAVRAAGSANGANPVAVLVPCHRVVRADGLTGGYAYGEAIKKELLKREK